MAVTFMENTLKFEAFIDREDPTAEDNVCLRFTEDCPEEEKVFYAGESTLYLTREQARGIAEEILRVLKEE